MNNYSFALREVARVQEEVAKTFSSLMLSSSQFMRELADQIPQSSQDVVYFNVEECASFLKISVPHLYRLTSEHKIPFSKPGRTLRFNKQEIIEWVAKHRVATDAELLGG